MCVSHTHTNTHTHTHTHIPTKKHTHINTHIDSHACMHAHGHTRFHTGMHAYKQAHSHPPPTHIALQGTALPAHSRVVSDFQLFTKLTRSPCESPALCVSSQASRPRQAPLSGLSECSGRPPRKTLFLCVVISLSSCLFSQLALGHPWRFPNIREREPYTDALHPYSQ